MKKLILLCGVLVCSASMQSWGATTNVMATRQWVLGVLAASGLNTNNFTNSIGSAIVASNRVVASCNWFTSTNYNVYNATISSNAVGLYRLSVTNNLGIDFVQRTNGIPIIHASVSTNAGCTVGIFMVNSNTVDFYTRTNGLLAIPESIQAIVTR